MRTARKTRPMPEFSTGPPHPHNRKDSLWTWRVLTDFLMHVRNAMNITPEQIPDEVAEMLVQALIDWEQDESDSALTTHVKAALAAALPALLGEPVGWMRRNITYKDTDGRRDGERILSERKVFCDDISLYTLPTPETHNAHP